jgi:DHA2 family multidrug resistance protein
VGLALTTTVLQQRMTVHASLLDQHHAVSTMPWGEMFVDVQDVVRQAGEVGTLVDTKALALMYQHLLQQATVAAYQDCFVLLTAMTLAVMPLVFFLRRRPAA